MALFLSEERLRRVLEDLYDTANEDGHAEATGAFRYPKDISNARFNAIDRALEKCKEKA